jgi:UDP-N-acetylmuramate: L-alanyl-gamma-D-glutamyl-meso-diaminopimelate ligase
MHQLAIALHRKNNQVTGSDDAIADPARSNLEDAGLLPKETGWFPERITPDIQAVVLGMHAKEDNPELLKAQELGLPVFSFPQYVYEVSREKQRVVVAGSHGKTTITSMIMHVLKAAGRDFDYLVGAKVAGFDGSVRLSDAPLIVLEGDEYPASAIERKPKIFFYHPHISVLSGIAWDHVNVFPTFANYISQFAEYLSIMKPGAKLIFNGEDSEVKMVVEQHGAHLEAAEYCTPDYHHEGKEAVLDTPHGPVRVAVFGWHNLLNLEAARNVCNELGIGDEEFYRHIASFNGAARRLERLFEKPGLIAFRDFAHAPSKLRATLGAVKDALPNHKVVAVFELHTFSSLKEEFLQQYSGAMNAADEGIIFFSQHALELKGLPPLKAADVHKHFGKDALRVIDDREQLISQVRELSQAADNPICLLLMSSGTFEDVDWQQAVAEEAKSVVEE